MRPFQAIMSSRYCLSSKLAPAVCARISWPRRVSTICSSRCPIRVQPCAACTLRHCAKASAFMNGVITGPAFANRPSAVPDSHSD